MSAAAAAFWSLLLFHPTPVKTHRPHMMPSTVVCAGVTRFSHGLQISS